jgi:hypothetical protein
MKREKKAQLMFNGRAHFQERKAKNNDDPFAAAIGFVVAETEDGIFTRCDKVAPGQGTSNLLFLLLLLLPV